MTTSTHSPSRELSIRRSARLLGKHGIRRSPRLLEKSAMAVSKRVTLSKVSVYPNTKNDQGKHVVKVHRAVPAKKKFLSTCKSKHRLNQIMRVLGMCMKAVSYTSIVGMRTETFGMVCVDSRLVAEGFLTVLSNRYRKVIFMHNEFEEDDSRFRLVCAVFSGGNKLQESLSEGVPDELTGKLYPFHVAHYIRERLEEMEKLELKKKPEEREVLNNQVLVMGISETLSPQIFSVSSSSIEESSTTPTMKNIEGYCIAGSGVKWMKSVLEAKLGSPNNLPVGITSKTAKGFAMDALIKAAQNDVLSGGYLHAVVLSKVGDKFYWTRSYKYQKDFDNEKGKYINWFELYAPEFDN